MIVTDFHCGMNTMMVKDHKNRVYKTGHKIDYTPRLIKFNEDLLPRDKVDQIMCGKQHYVVLDKDNNLHTVGHIFKEKAEQTHDGFGVYDGDQIFEGNKVKQLSMEYEIYGALVEDA